MSAAFPTSGKTSPALRDAALAYARRGWPVLPLHWPTGGGCSCGRVDCGSPAKHPLARLVPNGLKDASADVTVVDAWWRECPGANVGLVTGVAFDVLDIDGPEAVANLVEAQAAAGATPPWPGPEVSTGRGVHLYHLATGFGNRAGIVSGVDFRGKGGYVVAPPSRHISGHVYRWAYYDGPDGILEGPDEPLTELPGWLRELVAGPRRHSCSPPTRATQPAPYAQRALEAEVGRVLLAPVGQRNDQLNRAAFSLGQLVGAGVLDAETVTTALFAAADRAGLGELEAERTIASGLSSGMRQPRGVPA